MSTAVSEETRHAGIADSVPTGRVTNASTWYKGSLVTFLAESKDTGGSFALLEAAMKPGNEPPPPHPRARGRALLRSGGRDRCLCRGRSFPSSGRRMRVSAEAQAARVIMRSPQYRMLILVQPGGVEGYFRSMSASPAGRVGLAERGDHLLDWLDHRNGARRAGRR